MSSEKTKKKTHGIFYTPDNVASLLCDWAIRFPSDTVLEPSFGGCGFLRATNNRLIQVGVEEKETYQSVFGSDIDPAAFDHLKKIFPYSNGHFIQQDFLSLRSERFPSSGKFSVVIGNPPYVSHHNMLSEQKKAAWDWLNKSPFHAQIDKRSSLWVYFVLHGLSFLKDGGRIVWVLPGSFLHADYADQVRKILQQRFKRILSIVVGSRLFLNDGTEETSIFLLGDGYLPEASEPCKAAFSFASYPQEVPQIIKKWEEDKIETQVISILNLLPEKVIELYQKLVLQENTISLGDVFDVRIGIVSGANDFFIMDRDQWKKHQLPNNRESYILTRFKDTKGLTFTKNDLNKMLKSGNKNIFLDTSQFKKIPKSVQSFLDHFPVDRLETTTFKRRISKPWHHFNDKQIPDAFLPYMNNDGPRVAINTAKVNSTNSVHRLFYTQNYGKILTKDIVLKEIAISMLSTFSQLSAELEGRTYGAGVLKHEPSEAKKIKLIFRGSAKPEDKNTIIETFNAINKSLREDNRQQAQMLADEFVLSNISVGKRNKILEELSSGLALMRTKRSPKSWKGSANEQ